MMDMESSQASLIEQWVATCNTRCLQRIIGKENADGFIRKDGTTPLHLAAALPKEAESVAVATVLLSGGANPNVPNHEGKTSMHVAAFMGHTELLQLLLLNGGDPLLGDRRGCSPVDWAHHRHHQNTLKLLNNLLDTEEFIYDKNDPKFTLSFMRVTVMDTASFFPTWMADSIDSFYSCSSNIQNCDGTEVGLKNCIENFNKPHPKSDQACISDKPPAWLSNHPFLKSLKQEVEMYQDDSDSENDLWTLQYCLGKKLHQELSSCETTESESGCTLMELNIGHLTINVSSNTSHDAVVNGHQSFEEQSLYNESSRNKSSTCNARNYTLSSQNSSAKVNEKERSEVWLRQTDDDVTDKNNYNPEPCTTLHPVKCPIKKDRITNIVHKTPLSIRKELFDGYCNFELSTSSISNNSETLNKSEEELSCQNAVNPITSAPSSLKLTNPKTVQSLASTCPSVLSIAEEFLYKDTETGIQFIERRCPTLAVLSSYGGTSGGVSNRPGSSLKEVLEELVSDKSFDSVGPITDSIKAMNVEGLRDNLRKLGFEPGPITPSTHSVYMRHLLRLRKKPYQSQDNQSSPPKYCKELCLVLRQPLSIPWEAWTALEEEMSLPFSRPDPTRHWRDGTSKSCFNYVLLDPRITQNLPIMGSAMDEKEKINCFVASIFYVGKGSRNRPYYHLYDAMKKQKSKKQNKKIEKIQEIWADDSGVVSLHVFQNTIPVEAWTREAAMISALGLKNISNSMQGTFYGPASTWTNSKRHQLGTHLLYRSFNIFLQEGERQLRPCDIAMPFRADMKLCDTPGAYMLVKKVDESRVKLCVCCQAKISDSGKLDDNAEKND